MNSFKSKLIPAVATLAFCASGAAVAGPITGSLEMGGSFTASLLAGSSFLDPDYQIDFFLGNSSTGAGQMLINNASGDFATEGVGFPDIGSINSLQIDASAAAPANACLNCVLDPFYQVEGFSFALDSVVINEISTLISLEGTGVISHAGYDDTEASWFMSGQAGGGIVFGWSASTGVASTPIAVTEPGEITLLAIGLLGLFVTRKKLSTS